MPRFLRRRPLLRAAAIGGGAYQLGKRRAQEQEQDAAQEQRIRDLESQQSAPAPTAARSPGISSDAMQKLQELGQLHEQGVLTEEEFSTQKTRLLAN